jgi:hypothetical protein
VSQIIHSFGCYTIGGVVGCSCGAIQRELWAKYEAAKSVQRKNAEQGEQEKADGSVTFLSDYKERREYISKGK